MWFCSYQFLFFNTGTVILLTWLPSFTVLISVSVLTDGKIPMPGLQLRAGASVSRCSVLLRHSLISSAEPFCYCLPLSYALVGLRKLGNACDCLLCAFTWVSFWFKKKKRKKQKPKPKTQKLKLTCKHKPILLSPVGG